MWKEAHPGPYSAVARLNTETTSDGGRVQQRYSGDESVGLDSIFCMSACLCALPGRHLNEGIAGSRSPTDDLMMWQRCGYLTKKGAPFCWVLRGELVSGVAGVTSS
jgi:hypothetical protein